MTDNTNNHSGLRNKLAAALARIAELEPVNAGVWRNLHAERSTFTALLADEAQHRGGNTAQMLSRAAAIIEEQEAIIKRLSGAQALAAVLPEHEEAAEFERVFDGYKALIGPHGKRNRSNMFKVWMHFRCLNSTPTVLSSTVKDSLSVGGDETLPHWEPCNPGCDPAFNGQRSRECALLCQQAREALYGNPGGVDKRTAFREHLSNCAADVATWPEWKQEALQARAALTASAQSVPEGWKMVPVEATTEMVEALKARIACTSRGGILNAGNALNDAIAAAPAPKQERNR